MFERNNQTFTKEKARKKTEETKKWVSKKGVDGQKAKKNDGSLKGKTKGKQGQKAEQKEKKGAKKRAFGGTKEDKTPKIAGQ